MELLTLPVQAASPASIVAAEAGGTNSAQPGSGVPAGMFADLLALQLGLNPELAPAEVAADETPAEPDAVQDQELLADAAFLAGLGMPVPGLPPVAAASAPEPASATRGSTVRAQIALPALPRQAASVAAEVRPRSPAEAGDRLMPLAFAATLQTHALTNPSPTTPHEEVPRQALATATAAIAATATTAAAVAATASQPDALPVKLPDTASNVAEQIAPATAIGPAVTLIPTSHAVAAAGSAPAAQPYAVIASPVATPAWGGALGERVVWMVGQQHQGVELHLNPAALGPLEVKLSISDGQANLSFATQHAPVREAIEAATPRLREMLAESGISLGSVSVNVGAFTQSPPGEHAQRQAPVWTGLAPAADFSSLLPAAVTVLGHKGMVDIFA